VGAFEELWSGRVSNVPDGEVPGRAPEVSLQVLVSEGVRVFFIDVRGITCLGLERVLKSWGDTDLFAKVVSVSRRPSEKLYVDGVSRLDHVVRGDFKVVVVPSAKDPLCSGLQEGVEVKWQSRVQKWRLPLSWR
jgi:hypothetical protein